MRSEITRMSIDVKKEIHRLIRVQASLKDQTVKDFVVEAILEKLTQFRKPNATTLQAFKDSDQEQNLNTYPSLEALYQKLGL